MLWPMRQIRREIAVLGGRDHDASSTAPTTVLLTDAGITPRPMQADAPHGIASAHFMCPSKPSSIAMAR
jgi:hypothetical protein